MLTTPDAPSHPNGGFDLRPLYLKVKDDLSDRIARGEWKVGAILPNEGELARTYKVSSGTVRKALDELERERRLTRVQGRGTFVLDAAALNDERMRRCCGKAEAIIEDAMNEAGGRSVRQMLDPLKTRIARALFDAGAEFPT